VWAGGGGRCGRGREVGWWCGLKDWLVGGKREEREDVRDSEASSDSRKRPGWGLVVNARVVPFAKGNQIDWPRQARRPTGYYVRQRPESGFYLGDLARVLGDEVFIGSQPCRRD